MKLTQIEISDFKSIRHAIVDVPTNQLCFVGKNECGKSSIIQAIHCLNFLATQFQRNQLNKESPLYPNGNPVVTGIFKLDKTSYKHLLEILGDKKPPILPSESDASFVQVKRWGNGIHNLGISLSDKTSFFVDIFPLNKENSSFIDRFTSEIYPTIEYYENEELLIEPATVKDLIGADRRFETFRRLLYLGGCRDLELLANDDDNFLSTYHARIEDTLNAILRKHYKQDDSITLSIRSIRGDKLNVVIKDSSKQTFSIEERSPGFRYYFSFLINKLWIKDQNGSKNVILLLDEPGSNLHPSGAKDLLRTFESVAETSQILFTTHNPFLTIRNNLESLSFVTKSPTQGTKPSKKPYLNKYQILRKELGILLNDSFVIGDINLVVEGSTEKMAFHRLFQMERFRELEWMNIYDSGGVTNISQALNYLGPKNLDLAGIAFLDSDPQADKERAKAGFKDNMASSKWDWLEVNSAFTDKKSRTFEDLFPQKLYIDAFNHYCSNFCVDTFERDYVNFEFDKAIATPIINTLHGHYLTFVEESKRKDVSISKQTVISILFDKVDEMQQKDRDKALEILYKVCDELKTKFKYIENNVGK